MSDKSDGGLPPITPLSGWQHLLFLCGIAFLWPALLNGAPFQFRDTLSYLRAANTALVAVTGYASPALGELVPAATAPDVGQTPGVAPAPRLVIYGRSVYFGAFLYLGIIAGSLWLPVLLQAGLAGGIVVAAVRHFVDPGERRRFTAACLAAFALLAITPLPYFVCFLMPDLLVGLTVVSAALLLGGWTRERPWWRSLLAATAAFAAASHSSAVAILAVAGLAGLVAGLCWRRLPIRLPAALMLAAALLGLAGDMAFGTVTRAVTGTAPLRPPFVTARLIDDDGPGRRYLTEHCGEARFVLCRYPLRGRVTEEIFLWSEVPAQGGFKALPPAGREAVAQEQGAFVLAVVGTYPLETAQALTRDLMDQFGRFGLDEFASDRLAVGLANRGIAVTTLLLTLVSLALLPVMLRRHGLRRGGTIVLLVCAGILANDVICAWLSGPFSRYQTRVIWALPLALLLWVLAARRGTKRWT